MTTEAKEIEIYIDHKGCYSICGVQEWEIYWILLSVYISTESQLTSVAYSTVARGIHKTPKMLSQSKPFFHSSIMKPFPSAWISL